MTTTLREYLDQNGPVVRVSLERVRGSSPRESGTEMIVSATGAFGTIGGGRLEHLAIERARAMLTAGELRAAMDVPLGPEIGQCCGGRVEIGLARMSRSDRQAALHRAAAEDRALPQVLIFGAGHVGRALADLMQHMPVRPVLVDMRQEEIARCTARVETRISAIPEVDVETAEVGSAFIVATHDHALDFLVASAALERSDAAYVGLIGSRTKRAKFDRWAHAHCDGLTSEHLTCPIGAGGSRDKRPSVIAALVTAEVMTALTRDDAATAPRPRRLRGRAAPTEDRVLEGPRG